MDALRDWVATTPTDVFAVLALGLSVAVVLAIVLLARPSREQQTAAGLRRKL